MRKPRDYDAELKALDDKASQLKERKVRQLGELVIACRADVLPVEELAGALLQAADNEDLVTREEWRKRGAGFFRSPTRRAAGSADRGASSRKTSSSGPQPAAGEAGAS